MKMLLLPVANLSKTSKQISGFGDYHSYIAIMAERGEKMIKYEAPKMEIVTFEAEDVITTSGIIDGAKD